MPTEFFFSFKGMVGLTGPQVWKIKGVRPGGWDLVRPGGWDGWDGSVIEHIEGFVWSSLFDWPWVGGLIEVPGIEDIPGVSKKRGGVGLSRRNFSMISWNNSCWPLVFIESNRIFLEKMSKGLSLAGGSFSSSLPISGLVKANFGNSVREGRTL